MSTDRIIELATQEDCRGLRLDQFLATRLALDGVSRSSLQTLVRDGRVLVDRMPRKSGFRLQGGETITVAIPPATPTELQPEQIAFEVLYEDRHLLVLTKPPGVVVHPAAGHDTGTLVHGLLHHCDGLSGIGGELRPGIVHRLDKDTSGVLVVAKNDTAHRILAAAFKARQVKKTYMAILEGTLPSPEGRVTLPIGRHAVDRKKMAADVKGGREALTQWRVLEAFRAGFTFVELQLNTGRTHQIRVHMAAMGAPVAADPLYGRKNSKANTRYGVHRQCLHAYRLAFAHPETGVWLEFVAPLPPDMAGLLDALRSGKEAP